LPVAPFAASFGLKGPIFASDAPGARPNACRIHMDIEHINALGAQIADLTQRTAELRRYL
jgi:hypothetical protein